MYVLHYIFRGSTFAMSSKLKRKLKCIGSKDEESSHLQINSAKSAKKVAKAKSPSSADEVNNSMGTRLAKCFYNQSCKALAKALLGKVLVRHCKDTGERLRGVIVETEAYLGGEDKGAHSYNGKRTKKTEAMFMEAGTCYVYNIYGTYCCMNISSEGMHLISILLNTTLT